VVNSDARSPVIQMEEPQIHMVPVRGKAFGKLDVQDLVGIFNKTVKGLRAKTEMWCHTCWGNAELIKQYGVDVIEVVGHTDEHPTLITSFSRC
jgi:methionine synthase II (cobalamin-independent)